MSPEQLLGELEGEDGVVIGDLEAGTGTVLRLQPGAVDAVVVVAQPTAKALDVAGRLSRTAAHRSIPVVAVANRVRGDEDVEAVRRAVATEDVVAVPDEPGILQADRDGRAPLDAAPDSPGVQALVDLARRLARTG